MANMMVWTAERVSGHGGFGLIKECHEEVTFRMHGNDWSSGLFLQGYGIAANRTKWVTSHQMCNQALE